MTDVISPINVPPWKGTNVTMADIEGAIDDLRRTEQRAATRTSVATLIIVVRSLEQVDEAEAVIAHLGIRHPARIVTLLVPVDAADAKDRVDGEVRLHAGEAAGHAVWSDEIRLAVSGGPSRHLASLVRPLQLPDLPTVVWYVSGLPNERDPLLKLADAVVVDTKTVTPTGEETTADFRRFDKITALIRRHTIIDLSWNRLRTWRTLLASMFDGVVYRPFVAGVDRVEITGKLGPRTLLAGWVADRLRLEQDVIHLHDGRHVRIELHARHEEKTAEFLVERIAGERLVRASATIHDGPSHNELLSLPDDALPLSVSSALKLLQRDKIYEQAIKTIGAWQ